MESQRSSVSTWGIALIVLGVIFLLGQVMPWFSDLMWAGGMAAVGLVFLTVYGRNRSQWWALIPAYVFFAIAGLILLDMLPLPGDIDGAYVMFAIAAPFFYVYLRNRQNWWALIPSGIMAFIGLGLLMDSVPYLVPAVLILIGVVLLVRQFSGSKPASALVSEPLTGPEADKARE